MPLPEGMHSGQDDFLSEATDEPEDHDIDMLDVMEAMGAHFHEHHADIMRWSWKLFCRKWVRLIKWAAEEREKERQREVDRAFEKLREGR